jgi:hypothetical protein
MQAFEPHHVVHKSFTGLWTTAALDDRIRSVGLPIRGGGIATAQAEVITRSAYAGRNAERDSVWSDRVVTTTSDDGTSTEKRVGNRSTGHSPYRAIAAERFGGTLRTGDEVG